MHMTLLKKRSKFVDRQLEMSKYDGKRIHSSQIHHVKIDELWARLKDVKSWTVCDHTTKRIRDKGIKVTYEDIVSTLLNSVIVEYKIDYDKRINRCEERIVVRSNAIVNRSYNLNVVFNLSRKEVVTVWINHVRDLHETLDWSIYTSDLKIFDAE